MPGYNGPQFQNMCSYMPEDKVRADLECNRRIFGATESDCWIEGMKNASSWEQKKGIQVHYRLHWTSYLGWKTYMLCTGCLASDPTYEREHGTETT